MTGILLVSVAVVLVGATFLYMKQDKFGASPAGDRLDKIRQSEQFVGGIFVNQVPTPDLTEGYSMWVCCTINSLNRTREQSRVAPSHPQNGLIKLNA